MGKSIYRRLPWFFFLVSLLVFTALSCSRAEPTIAFGTLRLVYFQGAQGPEERFSFFIIPDDEDGDEDLADLYLYHDREGLCWHLSSDDWATFQGEGQTWIGSRNIVMHDNAALPRGQFRAVLVDTGGEQSERLFSFDAPEEARHPFPFLYLEEGRYRIESEYPEHFFVCYDGSGAFLKNVPVTSLEGDMAELDLPRETRAVALWAEDGEYFTSALTDVVPTR
jgi:hypothetical protein